MSNILANNINPRSGNKITIGNVNTTVAIAGTATYEDVTSIDSVGIITARSGINVTGGQLNVGSNIKIGNAGVITATSFSGDGSQLTGIDATQIQTGNTSVQTVDTGSDGHVKINTEGSERLRITSAGRVGIGTDNPGAILDVEGTLLVGTSGLYNGNATINGHLIVDRTGVSGTNPWLTVKSSGSTTFYVNGGGGVFADGSVNALGFTAGTSGTGNGNSSIFGSLTVDRNGVSGNNTWFQVKNGTNPIIYATGQGKVGIGTVNPTNLLHIDGGTDQLKLSDGTGSFEFRAGNVLMIKDNGTERLRIDAAGSITQGGKTASNHGSPNLLLWGTDPTMMIASTGSTNNSSSVGIKFTVAGGSTGDYSKAGIFVQRQSTYTDLDMIFAFRSTADAAGVAISDEKLRITSDGKVGIGVNSPTFKLDVVDGAGGANTGANVNNPDALSVTGTNRTLTSGGANLFVNSNSDLAADTGGQIALSGRHVTSSTNSMVHATIKGAKETAVSTNTNSYLAFAVSNHSAGALVERLRIKSDGDVSIADGNLVVASGHGIDFSATSNASGMTSEVLDHYEEGTFTPIASAGYTSPTYDIQNGYYTRIGNLLYVTGALRLTGGTGTGSGVQIGGMPFTSANPVGAGNVMVSVSGATNTASNQFIHGAISSNTTTIDLYHQTTTAIIVVAGSNLGNSVIIRFSGTWRV